MALFGSAGPYAQDARDSALRITGGNARDLVGDGRASEVRDTMLGLRDAVTLPYTAAAAILPNDESVADAFRGPESQKDGLGPPLVAQLEAEELG